MISASISIYNISNQKQFLEPKKRKKVQDQSKKLIKTVAEGTMTENQIQFQNVRNFN